MADPSWPDPARPGVPPNPERTAAHWFDEGGVHLIPCLWLCGSAEWDPRPPAHARYVGPCLTPAEHAAALAASRLDERQRAANVATAFAAAVLTEDGPSGETPEYATAQTIAHLILAQPAPDGADALAAMLAEAERRGIERAAVAGWNACRKSIYAACEDVRDAANRLGRSAAFEEHNLARGRRSAAKSIARRFTSMEAQDDDNLTAAIRALQEAKRDAALAQEPPA